MANVLAQLPQSGFNHSHSPSHPPLPVAPTPAIMAGWGPVVHQSSSSYQLPATRVQKRRLEQEDDDEARQDVVMERSPTPERPRQGPPKKARRVDPSTSDRSQNNQDSKGGGSSENEVDIGVLLGIFYLESVLMSISNQIYAQPHFLRNPCSQFLRP